MPYKQRGSDVLHYKNGKWSVKQRCSSSENAKKAIKLLHGVEHGMKPRKHHSPVTIQVSATPAAPETLTEVTSGEIFQEQTVPDGITLFVSGEALDHIVYDDEIVTAEDANAFLSSIGAEAAVTGEPTGEEVIAPTGLEGELGAGLAEGAVPPVLPPSEAISRTSTAPGAGLTADEEAFMNLIKNKPKGSEI